MKEQTRNTGVQTNEEEIGKLPEKYFRIMIVKMIKKKNLENKMEKMQESINKDLEELKEKAIAPHSSTLAWKIPWMEATVHGVAKSQTRLSNFTFLSFFHLFGLLCF